MCTCKTQEAHKSQDVDAIAKPLPIKLVWQVASEEMYKTAQNSGQIAPHPGPDQPGETGNAKSGNDEVTR